VKKLLYVGSSWAVRSFDRPYENPPGPADVAGRDYVNLASELGLDVVNLSKFNYTNTSCYDAITRYTEPYDAVVWVYCDPFKDLATDQDHARQEFFESDNFWDIRNNINDYTMKLISSLDCPVALIGGPSDVANANYSNLTVIHPSWQRFLAEHCDVELTVGWDADAAHAEIKRLTKIKPSRRLVELITDTLDAWKKLEQKNVFSYVHPNSLGTKLFASHIKPGLNTWLDNL